MEPYWDVIRRLVKESDIVLEIIDARLIELSRIKEAEEIIKEIGRPMIFVVNKTDLVSEGYLKKQLKELRKEGTVVFVSVKDMRSVKTLLYAIKKNFSKFGKREPEFKDKFSQKPKYREAHADIVVGVLGYPNVGKSSIINCLSHRKKAKVSKKAGTTHGLQWIKATNDIKLLDSPGVIPLSNEDELKHGLIGAKDPERLNDLETVANKIIELFLKNNRKSLEEFYKIELNSEDPSVITEEIAKKKSYLIKGGNLDKNRARTTIIRDWQNGKLRI
jgi:ribosome biogenesis GTPase A